MDEGFYFESYDDYLTGWTTRSSESISQKEEVPENDVTGDSK